MGVTGSGKSTVGRMLADRVNATFADADDFHSAENVAKMAASVPLTERDLKARDAVLIVTDQASGWVSRERCFAGARQSEE